MALVFGGTTTDKCEYTPQAVAINVCPLTIWAWIYPTTLSVVTGLFAQRANAGGGTRALGLRATGELDFSLDMTTVDAQARSNSSNQVTINTWWFVAATVTASFVPRLYFGTLTTPVAEVSGYTTQLTGTGTKVTDSTGTGRWGNTMNPGTNSFAGRIACGAYLNKDLSLAELTALQYWPRRTVETVLYHQLGLLGTGTQDDLTGNGHTATVTGATLGDHVPLPLPFGQGRRRAPYAVTAAVPTLHPWAHGGQDARFAALVAQ